MWSIMCQGNMLFNKIVLMTAIEHCGIIFQAILFPMWPNLISLNFKKKCDEDIKIISPQQQ